MVTRSAAILLLLHFVLLAGSIPYNAVTIDEVVHLPAGISYYHYGEFWSYHHNPPVVRLLFALPAVLIDVPTDYGSYHYVPGSRAADSALGRDFMLLNQRHYQHIFTLCRLIVAGMSVLGGWVVWRWSTELFGAAGGLISLGLWALCPNVLAHGGLVTTDVGATSLALCASYQFWRYLRAPSLMRAVGSGILLGVAEASKYTFIVLPAIWAGLALLALAFDRRRPWTVRVALGHAMVLAVVALTVLNDIYLFEGAGKPLGSFNFHSRALTRDLPALDGGVGERDNRFRGTVLEHVRAPLPEHYLLGFDAQMWDVDSGSFYKYLGGELRDGTKPGWLHYYLYCLLVKTPLGTLALLTISSVLCCLSRFRTGWLNELNWLMPVVVLMISVSSNTRLNSHLRYVLPVLPFLFLSAGRLGWVWSKGIGWQRGLILAAFGTNLASVLSTHPHYLAYFHEAVGGRHAGLKHLADSNIDWGQGLIALQHWLKQHAPNQKIQLAYFGTMYPEVLNINYELPPFGPAAFTPMELRGAAADVVGPAPGLQAVSANYLLGIPFPAPNANGQQSHVPADAYVYYRMFKPIARPGYSIFVYDLSIAEVNDARRQMGLQPWPSVPSEVASHDSSDARP